ncbi:MAG TPA: tetratricopeptide repeat protein [Acidobacteriaceae bacterium]|nr:tetratricopeptide repeat protein [Acidobacteriaceae bacterium]
MQQNHPALRFTVATLRNAIVLTLIVLLVLLPVQQATAQGVDTNPLNHDPLVQEGFRYFYGMNYVAAQGVFRRVEAAHPADPIATDYILYVTIFQELFRLDLLDTTFYANDGFLTGKHTVVEDPKVRDEVKGLAQKAIDQANAELKGNPNDVNALFARGWGRSLEAVYVALVERGFGSALKLALGAKNDSEKVLQLDPNYVDAKLVVGVYQYVIGALPFAFKLLIGFAGIHGSKTEGLATLQDAANRGVITSVEARTVMAFFLRREAKYQQALAINASLVAEYPHDFLFCLERANLAKDAGEGMKAAELYEQVISDAKRPGYFASAHVELAYFGLGDSLRGQKLYSQAAGAYREGAFQATTSPELKQRCLLAAGQAYDLMHEHDLAREQYLAVLAAGGNTSQAELARRYMDSPYRER